MPHVAVPLKADGITADKPQRQVLTAGEQLRVAPDSVPVVAMVDVGRAVAWESGHLVFADEPLSSVVERINRYATRPVKVRSEEHTSELQSLMRNSYAVFCLKKKKKNKTNN